MGGRQIRHVFGKPGLVELVVGGADLGCCPRHHVDDRLGVASVHEGLDRDEAEIACIARGITERLPTPSRISYAKGIGHSHRLGLRYQKVVNAAEVNAITETEAVPERGEPKARVASCRLANRPTTLPSTSVATYSPSITSTTPIVS
jgi:hypothetical protein